MPRSITPGSACRSQHEGDAVFGSAGVEHAKICIPGCLRQMNCYMYGVHVHMNKHSYEIGEIVIKTVYTYEHGLHT